MSEADNELDYVRITIRVSRYSDPLLFHEIAALPPFHRSRRFSTLAGLGLVTEKNQGMIATAPIQGQLPSTESGLHSNAVTPVAANKTSTAPLPTIIRRAEAVEDDVHYPGAGNTNVNFESVFGPME